MINYRNDHNQSIAGCHVHKFFIIKVKGCISSIINILNKVLNAYTFSLFSNIAQEDIKYNMSLIREIIVQCTTINMYYTVSLNVT